MTDPEKALQESWSIGRLRPWLSLLAEREMPEPLRGRIDPSDVVQQTLLQAWRGEQEFRGTTQGERLAWLRVILKNTIRQSQRAQTAQKRGLDRERNEADGLAAEGPPLAELAIAPTQTASGRAIAAEQTLALAEALQRLPDEQRRVIEMRHFEGKSHSEIAALLQKSPAAVRMLWVRALRNLK